MGIRGSATANQTRLLGHISDVLPVANPAGLGPSQQALVYRRRSLSPLGSIRRASRPWPVLFLHYLRAVCSIGREDCKLRSERLPAPLANEYYRKNSE
jgi:hypothetical protein